MSKIITITKDDAILLVDFQIDFLPFGALQILDGFEAVRTANLAMMLPFGTRVATQDWHPTDHGSFARVHNVPFFSRIKLAGVDQTAWPDHCVQNTRGAEFADQLQTHMFNAVFRKGMDPTVDSYSGFFDNNMQNPTGLEGFLTARNVKRVFVCGLALDVCVKWTAVDSARLGFETYVIEDACRGLTPDGIQDAYDLFKKENISVATLQSLAA